MSDELPHGWGSASLEQIAEINPRHPKGLDDRMPVTFVPMAGLSETKPGFQFIEERPLGEVRKGFTHFAEGDVLFAKITPCMENGKGAVARGLRNKLGCGTTELHVVRPLGHISPDYIYRFLAQPRVRRAAKENFTGTAGQARVPTSFIEELEMPLAPLGEQRRIVAKLETLLGKVDACQQRLAKIPILLKNAFANPSSPPPAPAASPPIGGNLTLRSLRLCGRKRNRAEAQRFCRSCRKAGGGCGLAASSVS